MDQIEIGTVYHMGIAKRYLAHMVAEDGADAVLANWSGTDEEAMQAIMDGPDFMPIGSCDNWDEEKGRCGGHPNED